MAGKHGVYLEVGTKKVFACSIDWPGWCRWGRDEQAALQLLVDYGPRYGTAVSRAKQGFQPPRTVADLRIAERVKGNATTDFGAPGIAARGDDRPLSTRDLDRLLRLHGAAWAAFDEAVKRHAKATLSVGPRGGGRKLPAIVEHVMEADQGYVGRLGAPGRDTGRDMDGVREAFVRYVGLRARGEPLPPSKRTGALWSPRFAIRRSAWHALDHGWEIEDRAGPG